MPKKEKVELTVEQLAQRKRLQSFRRRIKKDLAENGIRKGDLLIEGIGSIPKDANLRTGIPREEMLSIIRGEMANRKIALEMNRKPTH